MDELNKRIIEIMVRLDLNKTAFAKELNVSLPLITHITTGRNKPGIDIIQKIILIFDTINPDWLLNGTGDMFRNKTTKPDLSSVYNAIDSISSQIHEHKKVNSTIKSYHKILIDEIKHLEEMNDIIERFTQDLDNIVPQLESLKQKIESN